MCFYLKSVQNFANFLRTFHLNYFYFILKSTITCIDGISHQNWLPGLDDVDNK